METYAFGQAIGSGIIWLLILFAAIVIISLAVLIWFIWCMMAIKRNTDNLNSKLNKMGKDISDIRLLQINNKDQ